MTQVSVQQMIEDFQVNLDSDPRTFDQPEGAVHYWGTVVFYTKLPDQIILECEGVEYWVERP